MSSPSFRLVALALLNALPLLSLDAEVRLAPAFGDHMVLQRERPVPVWGTAAPGQKLSVAFAGQEVAATADADGRWRIVLAALEASAEPRTLRVTGGAAPTDRAEVNDVLVGEVWLGSGQSNMQVTAESFIPGAPTREPTDPKPNDKNLLHLLDAAPYPTVRLVCTTYKNNSVRPEKIAWQTASRENLLQFSAQFQSFGVPLARRLNVPVGLILIAVGGSPSGRWIDPAALHSDPHVAPLIAAAEAKFSRADEERKYAEALTKYEAEFAKWNQLPAADKKTTKAPGKPATVVAPGEGTRWAVGDLHANVLSPFIGYGICGVLWDQGESGSMIRAVDQFSAMQALIASWRREWGQADLPFCVVQKPSGGGCAFDPADPVFSWASDSFQPLPEKVAGDGRSRESNQNLATIPGVHLVPTSDLGSGLHPLNKFGYGTRALQVALARVYGQPGPSSGPGFRSAEVLADQIRVTFDHTDGGLCFRQGDRLQGFALAGADKKFVWAEARIEGETVIVSSPAVPAPRFVRYAWDDRPRWANLFNGAGLPALVFRTDP